MTADVTLLISEAGSIKPGEYRNMTVEIPEKRAKPGTVWTCIEQDSPYIEGLRTAARRISTKYGRYTKFVVIL